MASASPYSRPGVSYTRPTPDKRSGLVFGDRPITTPLSRQEGAAVHVDGLSRDVSARWTREVADHGCDILGLAPPPHQRWIPEVHAGHSGDTRGRDQAGNDAVHGDALGRQL